MLNHQNRVRAPRPSRMDVQPRVDHAGEHVSALRSSSSPSRMTSGHSRIDFFGAAGAWPSQPGPLTLLPLPLPPAPPSPAPSQPPPLPRPQHASAEPWIPQVHLDGPNWDGTTRLESASRDEIVGFLQRRTIERSLPPTGLTKASSTAEQHEYVMRANYGDGWRAPGQQPVRHVLRISEAGGRMDRTWRLVDVDVAEEDARDDWACKPAADEILGFAPWTAAVMASSATNDASHTDNAWRFARIAWDAAAAANSGHMPMRGGRVLVDSRSSEERLLKHKMVTAAGKQLLVEERAGEVNGEERLFAELRENGLQYQACLKELDRRLEHVERQKKKSGGEASGDIKEAGQDPRNGIWCPNDALWRLGHEEERVGRDWRSSAL